MLFLMNNTIKNLSYLTVLYKYIENDHQKPVEVNYLNGKHARVL